jgi:hypothetical protein
MLSLSLRDGKRRSSILTTLLLVPTITRVLCRVGAGEARISGRQLYIYLPWRRSCIVHRAAAVTSLTTGLA